MLFYDRSTEMQRAKAGSKNLIDGIGRNLERKKGYQLLPSIALIAPGIHH